MRKLYLMKHPTLFQGEKALEKGKNYFEGWYFKQSNRKQSVAFIPGISITNKKKIAFVQIITNTSSYFVEYNSKDFSYSNHPFWIKIGNCFFSEEKIILDIVRKNLKVKGEFIYSNTNSLKKSFFSPNIMGPFSYLPFMECNHAIVSMNGDVTGKVEINNKTISLKRASCYIEKDFGISFPKEYVWLQGNNFREEDVSFMLSIASVPFKVFTFEGVIAVFKKGEVEYRFTTYQKVRVIEYDISDGFLNITLENDRFRLNVRSVHYKGQNLKAPIKGKMKKNVVESISANIKVTLEEGDEIIYSGMSKSCGLEIVKEE